MRRVQIRVKRWIFTLNNYTELEVQELKNETDVFSYLLFGKEVAPSGTPHLQGYFELPEKRGPKKLAESLPGLSRARLAMARGTAKQNRTYCGKDTEPYVFGEPMKQGSRTDILLVKRKVDDGISNADLWQEDFATMLHNHRAISVYKKTIAPKRNWITNVILLVGPTNTHKSHFAHTLGNSGAFGTFFVVPFSKGNGLRFDGYDQHECILIDEMDGSRCKPTFLNSLCDRYEFAVPVHGTGDVAFLARTVIICSNYVPKDWWKHHNISTFMRRISIAYFTGSKAKAVRPHNWPPCQSGYWNNNNE